MGILANYIGKWIYRSAFGQKWLQQKVARILPYLSKEDKILDLGCGNAQIIGYLAKLYPECHFFGSDINHILIWWGRWRFHNLPNLTLKQENLFNTDISKADKVFVYLFPHMVTALLPRFKQELKPGAKVISLDFPITDYEPTEVIDLTDRHFRLSKHIYIYQF